MRLLVAALAAVVPLAAPEVFAQHDTAPTLVTLAAVDGFTAVDGTDLDGRSAPFGGTWTVHEGAVSIVGAAVTLDGSPTGRATLSTSAADVLVRADLTFPDGDRGGGVIVGHGPAGELRVLVERDGADQRVALYLDDAGAVSVLDTEVWPGSGLPSTVALRVEQRDLRLRVWLDGALLIDRSLTGVEATVAAQTAHGVILTHTGDGIDAFSVLAPAP